MIDMLLGEHPLTVSNFCLFWLEMLFLLTIWNFQDHIYASKLLIGNSEGRLKQP